MILQLMSFTFLLLTLTRGGPQLTRHEQRLREAAQEIESKQFARAEELLRLDLGQRPNSVRANNLMGLCQASEGSYRTAEQFFQKSIYLNPSFVPARINFGNVLLDLHQLSLALKQFKAALAKDPNALTNGRPSYRSFTLLGLCRMDEHQYVEARQAFQRCLQIDPHNATGYVNLGITLTALQRDREALPAFNKALAIRPHDSIALYNVGLIYARMKQFGRAVKYLQLAHNLRPDDMRVSSALAGAAIRCGKREEASALIESLQRHHGLDRATRQALASELLSSGRPASAARLVQGDPELASPFCRLAYSTAKNLLDEDQPGKCIRVLVAVRVLHPSGAEYHALLGSAYYEADDPKDASEEFQEAIRQDPHNSDYYFKLGMVFLKYHTPRPAIFVFQHGLKMSPRSPTLWFGLGLSEYFASDMTDGEHDLRKALALKRNYALAYVVLGDLLETTGRLNEAVQAFNRAIQAQPAWFVPYYMYGKAAADLGTALLPKAISMLRKAVTLNPGFARAHFELGSALMQAGQLPEAIQQLDKGLQLDPTLAAGHYKLGQIYLKLSNPGAATGQFRLFDRDRKKEDQTDAATRRLIVQISGH